MSVFTKPNSNILDHDPDYKTARNYELLHAILNDKPEPEVEALLLKLLNKIDITIKRQQVQMDNAVLK